MKEKLIRIENAAEGGNPRAANSENLGIEIINISPSDEARAENASTDVDLTKGIDCMKQPVLGKADDYEKGEAERPTPPTPVAQHATVAKLPLNKVILGDCLEKLKELPDNSIDLLATDPPYGMKFMGKNWDKAVPPVEILKEVFRAMKPGALAFIMCSPRQDCLARMIVNLEDAGFKLDFTSLYWTYASGFPKAHNISKAIDKKLGVTREIVGRKKIDIGIQSGSMHSGRQTKIVEIDETIATSPQAKEFDGAYGGFQPKPAVEVIIVAMKPMERKTFVDQALDNGKGVTWMDDCRIPYAGGADKEAYDKCSSVNGVYETGLTWGGKKVLDFPKAGARTADYFGEEGEGKDEPWSASDKGRFPANLLISDEVLDDGRKRAQGHWSKSKTVGYGDFGGGKSDYFGVGAKNTPDCYSRFFSIDAWAQENIPFLIVPKASKKEKDAGLELVESRVIRGRDPGQDSRSVSFKPRPTPRRNQHPTVKPLKLMAYLITMGSREGDIVLDPFAGSGSTCIAAKMLKRRFIGIELNEEYQEIAEARLENALLKKAA